ncbi:MAG TPA: hypothetical protein VG735_05880 [Caulobacterales bacterium]|nr:hypothetical protein [Caulobacterales bacterium]
MGEHSVNVWVNPLIFFGSEFRLDGLVADEVSYASLMGFLCRPGIGSQVSDLVARYNKISVEKNRLPIAPGEPLLLDRLIWPLRGAKATYITGNYLGTIALSGMVGEMAAILAFDMHNEAQDPVCYDKEQQKSAFGHVFENLGQSRRLKTLKGLGILDAETAHAFDVLRQVRNRYLHFWSEGHNQISDDATRCYDACITIVTGVLGMQFKEGKLFLRDEVFTYLNKHGVATPWLPPSEFLEGEFEDEVDEIDPTDPIF